MPPDGWYWRAEGVRGRCRACEKRAWAASRQKRTRERPCEYCGKPFLSPNPRRRFCSRSCKDALRNAAGIEERHAAKAAAPSRYCPTCGAQVPSSRRSHAAYCSEDCAKVARHTFEKARRRITGVGSDGAIVSVNRFDVYDRDGWVCQLCGEPVDRAARFPDPFAPSLDHIVPVARGGSHDITNLQTAHVRCNVARGARALTDPAPARVMDGRRFLTIREAAEIIGVHPDTLGKWVERPGSPVHAVRFREGGIRYISAEELQAAMTTLAQGDFRSIGWRKRRDLPDDGREYLTLAEAATVLGVPRQRLYAWARRGDSVLPVHKFGAGRGLQYVARDDVDALLARGPEWLDGRARRHHPPPP